MKRVLYSFLILALFISVTSCSKKGTKDLVIGTWQLESVEGEELTDAEKSATMTFSKEGTFERSAAGGNSQSGTYSVSDDGKTITVTPEGGDAESMSEVEIKDGKLSFKERDLKIVLSKKE